MPTLLVRTLLVRKVMGITIINTPLLRLLQLSSVSLPVGGYAFSQGLEYAVECGWVDDMDSTHAWLESQIRHSLAVVDLPILIRAYHGVSVATPGAGSECLEECNALALACRETKEMRLTDTAMGDALLRVLRNLEVPVANVGLGEQSFVVGFAAAASYWEVDLESTLLGYSWSWLENQVAAATKLVPLGQTQSQQLLADLQVVIAEAIAVSKTVQDDDIGACLPALAIASAKHETQYTRLFRS